MELTKELLKQIHPDAHPKYSLRLYKWLTSRRRTWPLEKTQVYFNDGLSYFSGIYVGYLQLDERYGSFRGNRLSGIVHGTRYRVHHQGFGWRGFELVPDFWEQYLELGKCHIDPRHSWDWSNAGERWDKDGDNRTCRWCGARYALERYTQTEECTRWVRLDHEIKLTDATVMDGGVGFASITFEK
jgi:hypothetical protein